MIHCFHLPMGETESPEEEVICHTASQWQSQEQRTRLFISPLVVWCPHDINSVYSSATVVFMTLGESSVTFILLTLKCMFNLSFFFLNHNWLKTIHWYISHIHGWFILSHSFFAGQNFLVFSAHFS